MSVLLITIIFLGLLGFIGAVVLYVTARKFHVEEDPRIDAICNELPGANCGGCGMKGCRDFATECVNRGSLAGLNCPVSGTEGMTRIATILGVESTAAERKIAVLRCNGNCTARPQIYRYDGEKTCAIMDAVGVGTSGCSYGCLGCGDCTAVCVFDAIHINNESGLPDVDSDKCTACGACVAECPRHILELRPTGPRDRRVWVACSSKDRGAAARKVCAAACIGCGKCARECPFGAINISDNLAYIMPDACKACGKCARVCPTGAILTSFTLAAAQS